MKNEGTAYNLGNGLIFLGLAIICFTMFFGNLVPAGVRCYANDVWRMSFYGGGATTISECK